MLVCVAFAANLVFIPSVSHFVKNGTWGGGTAAMNLPDPEVSIFGVSVASYTLMTWHGAAAFALAAGFFTQIVLARRGNRSARLVAVHRVAGPVILFTLLPVMIVFGVVRGLVGLRRGDRDLHADSMFLAFILLESAPIFRI